MNKSFLRNLQFPIIVLLLGSTLFFAFRNTDKANTSNDESEASNEGDSQTSAEPDHKDVIHENYRVYSPPVPTSIDFAGEAVPLNNTEVYDRLDRELVINTFWHSSTILIHKRAARWFPIIEPILKEEGVPEDLKYLAVIESGLDNAVSPAGARGFWQFMPATGKSYDLEINAYVDERYNLEKATRAACRLLKSNQRMFGSWTMAAAAYNMGPAGLQGRVDEQGVDDYYDLLLPEETMRYVFRICAAKQILNNSKDYGFRFRPEDLYEPYSVKAVEVSESIPDLAAFALENGTNLRLIKLLNPWLRSDRLPNSSGKKYTILLPGEGFIK